MWSFNTLGILTNINTSNPPSRDGQTQRWTNSKLLGIIWHILSKNNRAGQVWVKTISNYFGFGSWLWQSFLGCCWWFGGCIWSCCGFVVRGSLSHFLFPLLIGQIFSIFFLLSFSPLSFLKRYLVLNFIMLAVSNSISVGHVSKK